MHNTEQKKTVFWLKIDNKLMDHFLRRKEKKKKKMIDILYILGNARMRKGKIFCLKFLSRKIFLFSRLRHQQSTFGSSDWRQRWRETPRKSVSSRLRKLSIMQSLLSFYFRKFLDEDKFNSFLIYQEALEIELIDSNVLLWIKALQRKISSLRILYASHDQKNVL